MLSWRNCQMNEKKFRFSCHDITHKNQCTWIEISNNWRSQAKLKRISWNHINWIYDCFYCSSKDGNHQQIEFLFPFRTYARVFWDGFLLTPEKKNGKLNWYGNRRSSIVVNRKNTIVQDSTAPPTKCWYSACKCLTQLCVFSRFLFSFSPFSFEHRLRILIDFYL